MNSLERRAYRAFDRLIVFGILSLLALALKFLFGCASDEAAPLAEDDPPKDFTLEREAFETFLSAGIYRVGGTENRPKVAAGKRWFKHGRMEPWTGFETWEFTPEFVAIHTGNAGRIGNYWVYQQERGIYRVGDAPGGAAWAVTVTLSQRWSVVGAKVGKSEPLIQIMALSCRESGGELLIDNVRYGQQ